MLVQMAIFYSYLRFNLCAQIIVLLHAILYMTDSLPLAHTIFSIICHLVYLQNFSNTWPLISLTSLTFMASCVLMITDHFLWFFHFSRVTEEARHLKSYRGAPQPKVLGFAEITTFYVICVWLAPLFLFLSLSANDNALPMSAGKCSSTTVRARHVVYSF